MPGAGAGRAERVAIVDMLGYNTRMNRFVDAFAVCLIFSLSLIGYGLACVLPSLLDCLLHRLSSRSRPPSGEDNDDELPLG